MTEERYMYQPAAKILTTSKRHDKESAPAENEPSLPRTAAERRARAAKKS